MKYSERELKTFNIFALLLLSLGGLFFIFGVIEYVFQPTMNYTIARECPQAASSVQQSGESDVSSPETSGTLSSEESVDVQKHAQPGTTTYETVVVEGTNFKAVSNMLLGFVFLVLSFALNAVLLRVIRRGGYDQPRKTKNRKFKRHFFIVF